MKLFLLSLAFLVTGSMTAFAEIDMSTCKCGTLNNQRDCAAGDTDYLWCAATTGGGNNTKSLNPCINPNTAANPAQRGWAIDRNQITSGTKKNPSNAPVRGFRFIAPNNKNFEKIKCILTREGEKCFKVNF